MDLWMARTDTCSVNRFEEIKKTGQCILHRWPRSSEICDCSAIPVSWKTSMVNPQLMGYDSENGATLITSLRKKEEIFVWTEGK